MKRDQELPVEPNAARTIGWFSCGVASAIACKLVDCTPVYCETGSEDADNERFLSDCEAWMEKTVERIRSSEYVDTWDLWERRRWLSGPSGAACTVELKVSPRLLYQRPNDIHVFGYTYDARDRKRAETMRKNYPELTIVTPLIDRGLTKSACFHLLRQAGINRPRLYDLGFPNNNCVPCVKATSPGYWALVRSVRPEEFSRMAELSRRLRVRLAVMKGERVFIDEIPLDWPVTEAIAPSCDFLCHIVEQSLDLPSHSEGAAS